MSNAFESAFPYVDTSRGSLPDGDYICTGLTKRELIGAMAMQGILAASHCWPSPCDYAEIAERSLRMADTFLAKL